MNLATGIFTAPRDGVYHFQFSGVADIYVDINLRLNGANIGVAYADVGNSGGVVTASLQSTLQLKSGDRVDIYLVAGTLFDNSNRFSHFTGWLDEEDLQLQ